MPTQPDSRLIRPGPNWSGRFFLTSKFDLWYFCSLVTYKDVQYLVWKIWLISVWKMKAKVLLWLLTGFIFDRSTLISYHTEAFVKTEVGCTVDWSRCATQFAMRLKTNVRCFLLEACKNQLKVVNLCFYYPHRDMLSLDFFQYDNGHWITSSLIAFE